MGSAIPTLHCPALGQWAVKLLQCTASLPGGSGQWNSCNALPHYSGAAGSGTPAIHLLTLVTWHQSKSPEHGKCGTDCPHALPRSKPVVIRRDSSCVFPVSCRAHPARQPSSTSLWATHAILWGTNAPTWPPATARRQRSAGSVAGYHRGAADECLRHRDATARVERRRGIASTALRRHGAGLVAGHHRRPCAAQTIQRQRGATSVAAHQRGAVNVHACRRGAIIGTRRRRGTAQAALCLRGATSVAKHHRSAANVHVRHRGAIFRAEPHGGAAQTALRRPGASSATWHHRGAVNVHGAVVAQPSGQSATVALPRRFSCASLAMVYPPSQYSRDHGGVCTWRSANLRDTLCKGDESLAVLTASRAHRRTSPSRSGTIVVPLSRSRAVSVHVS